MLTVVCGCSRDLAADADTQKRLVRVDTAAVGGGDPHSDSSSFLKQKGEEEASEFGSEALTSGYYDTISVCVSLRLHFNWDSLHTYMHAA